MVEIENRIYVCDDILKEEYEYIAGKHKNEIVGFIYYNFVKDKDGTEKRHWNYADCLKLARSRARDKRYKNYEFLIIL